MEECLFRAMPLSLGALIGARFGHARRRASPSRSCCRRWCSAARTRTIRAFPSYSRLGRALRAVDHLGADLPALRPAARRSCCTRLFDLALFSIPLFLIDAPGARLQQRAGRSRPALVPLAIIAWRRAQRAARGASCRRQSAQRRVASAGRAATAVGRAARALAAGRLVPRAFQRALPALGVAGLVAWACVHAVARRRARR